MRLNLIFRNPGRLAGLVLLASLVSLAHTGCVRRRMTVRSNPSGALVYVDNQEIGVTPVSAPFTYYGTRTIQIFADGYEPLTVKQPFPAPWYEVPPLDFFFENIWPREIRDERVVNFDLQPQLMIPNEKLIERAQMLRGNSQAGVVIPLPSTAVAAP
jgi:hypothetical protein